MRRVDIPLDPSPRMLRQFAALWLVVLGGLAAWQVLVRDRATVAAALAVLAVVVGGAGLVWPAAIRPLFVGWMVLAYPVGWLVSHALLAAVYYGMFLPVGLVFRLIGRDALRLRRGPPTLETYWTPKPMPTDIRRYFRQF